MRNGAYVADVIDHFCAKDGTVSGEGVGRTVLSGRLVGQGDQLTAVGRKA
jgi:hypothetical protein